MSNFTKLCLSISLCFILTDLNAQIYLDLIEDGNISFEEVILETEKYFDKRGKGKGTGYKQFKRWEYFAKRSLDQYGKIVSNEESYKRFKSFEKKNSSSKSIQKTFGVQWQQMGPLSATNTATWSSHIGRVSALGIDPNDSDHLVIGSPGGGIWKTLNEGGSWTPIFDDGLALSCWSLLISHDNPQHYFAGISGNGIWRSNDGGNTWSSTSGTSGTINTILMNPNNHNVLLALSTDGRVYRSTNNGNNWTQIINIPGNAYDMEFKPGVHNTVYVSASDGIFQSLNNGLSFTEITGPWQNNPKMMAVTPHDNQYIYVLESNDGGFGALYRSTDDGSTWTTQMTDFCDCSNDDECATNNIMGYNQGECGGQAPRDMDVVVSDTNKDEVHVAGVETWKSTNGGTSFSKSTSWLLSSSLPFVHADVDLMVYKDGKMYFGTDGGLFTSTNSVASVVDLTTGLGIRQFYRIGVSKTELDRVSGGSQDNGTGILRNGVWYDFVGADGMETLIDKDNEDIVYATIQNGGLYKSVNGGDTRVGINNPPGQGDWVTPLEQDPIQSNTIYQGRQDLYKSINGGSSWTSISDFDPPNGSNRMAEIAIAPTDSDIIIAAFQRHIYKTIDGGVSWDEIASNIDFSNVNYVSFHPTNPDKILLCLSGTSARVMESTDGGVTWTNIHSGLPDVTAQSAIYENGSGGTEGIYVSMNPGVYYKSNAVHQWMRLDQGLPNVNVTELEIEHGFLYAATYGRGVWKTGLIDGLTCNIASLTDFGIQSCNAQNNTYTRNIQINFNYPPAESFIVVNNQFFPCLENNQIVEVEFPINGQPQNVTAYFSSQNSCSLTVDDMFLNISSCPCSITTANVQLESCDDKGTSTVADDTYSLSLNPHSLTGGDTYSVTGDITASNLSYGSPQIISNIPVGSSSITFNVIDDANTNCTLNNITFDPPNSCFTNYTCSNAFIIDNNGTYSAIGPSQGGGGSQSGRDANWFVFYPPSDGILSVGSCLQGVDTRLLLHEGNCNEFETLLIIDDSCELNPGDDLYASDFSDICISGNNIYYIEWDDRWSGSGFNFEFNFQNNAYYADVDGDGYGDPENEYYLCDQPHGYILNNTDCNDSNANVNPGAEEICFDNIDQNCNGSLTDGCTVEDCDGKNLNITNITQPIYSAEINLNSNAAVTGQNIQFFAGNAINLNPNFEVEQGASFEASIQPCIPITSVNKGIEIMEIIEQMELGDNFNASLNINISIFDIYGEKVFNLKDKDLKAEKLQQSVQLSKGYYLLVIKNGNKKYTTRVAVGK